MAIDHPTPWVFFQSLESQEEKRPARKLAVSRGWDLWCAQTRTG
jgi:hypothetical protein